MSIERVISRGANRDFWHLSVGPMFTGLTISCHKSKANIFGKTCHIGLVFCPMNCSSKSACVESNSQAIIFVKATLSFCRLYRSVQRHRSGRRSYCVPRGS
jgi:hypothetical protein